MPHAFPDRAALEAFQLERLRALLAALPENPFYAPAVRALGEVASLADFIARAPCTHKQQLVADQRAHPPYGSNLTYPLERYVRVHQTSSTTGEPLRWLDTAEDWSWMCASWEEVWRHAGLGAHDRLLCSFSFGPFLGFWVGWEAAQRVGALCIPGGALDSRTRLQVMLRNRVTALCCTPTYALRLAEVARGEGLAPADFALRILVVAGEPGGSAPQTRRRLREAFPGARVFDHHGMTEVGPVSWQTQDDPNALLVNEAHYLAEVLDPRTGATLAPDSEELGELVLTTLGRAGAPLLRYRTSDLVRPAGFATGAQPYLRLAGGLLGRADHMVVVRGVNLFPSAVDELVRSVPGVAEYRVRVDRRGALTELGLELEAAPEHDPAALCAAVADTFRVTYSLRVPVAPAREPLPRFELKARRWVEV
jgi:phenylacetate-CoA ligase